MDDMIVPENETKFQTMPLHDLQTMLSFSWISFEQATKAVEGNKGEEDKAVEVKIEGLEREVTG